MVKPFKVNISDQIIKDIYDKVKKYPWHEMPNDGGWEYGTNLDYMKEISKYWVTKFDWRKHEKEINKFPNLLPKLMTLIFILFMKKEADLNQCLCSLIMDGLEL